MSWITRHPHTFWAIFLAAALAVLSAYHFDAIAHCRAENARLLAEKEALATRLEEERAETVERTAVQAEIEKSLAEFNKLLEDRARDRAKDK
jgi:hypothetical protein